MSAIPLPTKKDVKCWADLEAFARASAARSARRNDPWAWAYWRSTAGWARDMKDDEDFRDPESWLSAARGYVREARSRAAAEDWIGAAQAYGRFKWLKILMANLGVRFMPIAYGLHRSLDWLRELEGAAGGAAREAVQGSSPGGASI